MINCRISSFSGNGLETPQSRDLSPAVAAEYLARKFVPGRSAQLYSTGASLISFGYHAVRDGRGTHVGVQLVGPIHEISPLVKWLQASR